uniref:hypothetical protein n=1 Tax=Xanthomonas sp. 0924 TaxID=2835534 RepID=UPI003F7EE0B4
MASLAAGVFSKTDASKLYEPLQAPLRSFQSGWVIPTLLIVAPGIAYLRNKWDSGRVEQVHEILDAICSKAFKGEKFDLEQHRRVTLFRYQYICVWRFPFFGGFLVPLERSGGHTRRTGSIFRVHDDGSKNEGVAGRAWSGEDYYVPNLPDLCSNPSQVDYEEYATKTFFPLARLRKMKSKPGSRAISAFAVTVANKKWGVLVIDTVRPSIREKPAANAVADNMKSLVAQLKGL